MVLHVSFSHYRDVTHTYQKCKTREYERTSQSKWLAQFRIWQVPDSNLDPETGCPKRGFPSFSQSLQKNTVIVRKM
jgi:hypothetical protein